MYVPYASLVNYNDENNLVESERIYLVVSAPLRYINMV